MRTPARIISTAASVAVLMGSLALAPSAPAVAASVVEEGKKLVENRKKGNCLACHKIEGGDMPGTIGPPLVAMKQRFPDKSRLREQIANPVKFNPNSLMPPFGKHNILTDDEIDKIVEYVYTL